MTLEFFANCLVRTNRAYELVPWSLVEEWDREVLARAMGGSSPFVLLPREGHGLHAKAVDEDGARLLSRLMWPEPIHAVFGRESAVWRRVAELVLDAVLEIEIQGTFVSGPASIDRLGVPGIRPPGGDRLARISMDALRYASALPISDARQLSYRLYMYNTVPNGARWTRAYPEKHSVADALGLGATGAQRERLSREYDEVDSPHWSVWRRSAGPGAERLAYKLYVSPLPDDLPAVFPEILTTFLEYGVSSFKVGCDLHGVLRPDKLVAYFPDTRSLETVAEALTIALPNCPPHGVPFSAAIDPLGLLSWGSDPPLAEQLPGWTHGESWRLWITNRLALALRHSTHAGSTEPWQYALRRLGVEGVDTASWAPTPSLWN